MHAPKQAKYWPLSTHYEELLAHFDYYIKNRTSF
ncbi:MAG: hypothetical protein ACD_4C00073G0003 [uncultured bacterium (gcode 4)]|uniref:Uncharacterized protein n=1 Tax=uncultured bacterium (gcode 4) TaxID=1234023 RepID=K2FYS5_9BACT|nr:MAG: hypothetical protein ACD_4C00073G0003 [uncultured bacterium (gcode 4)]